MDRFVREPDGGIGAHIVFTPDGTADLAQVRRVLEPLVGEFMPRGARIEVSDRTLSGDAEFARSPIALRIDLHRIVEYLQSHEKNRKWLPDTTTVFRRLGLSSLRELRVLIQPAGPHVQIETSVQFHDADPANRGLFAGIFCDAKGPSKLRHLVPADIETWHAGKLRLDVFTGSILDAFDPQFGVRDMMRESCGGLDIDKDVFAHLDADYLAFCANSDGVDIVEWLLDSGSIVHLARVRDPAKFDAGWRTLAAAHDLLSDEPETVAGAEIHVVNRAFEGVFAHARVGDLFAIARGEEGLAQLRKVIAPASRENPPKATGADVLERLATHAPPGRNGCGRFPIGGSWGGFEAIISFFPLPRGFGWLASTEPITRQLEELVAGHGLRHAHWMTGASGDRWRMRVFW
jgi:hypothetical protein